MTRVAVMELVGVRRLVANLRFGGLFVIFVYHWSILLPHQMPETISLKIRTVGLYFVRSGELTMASVRSLESCGAVTNVGRSPRGRRSEIKSNDGQESGVSTDGVQVIDPLKCPDGLRAWVRVSPPPGFAGSEVGLGHVGVDFNPVARLVLDCEIAVLPEGSLPDH
jgi:hypothetical protein